MRVCVCECVCVRVCVCAWLSYQIHSIVALADEQDKHARCACDKERKGTGAAAPQLAVKGHNHRVTRWPSMAMCVCVWGGGHAGVCHEGDDGEAGEGANQ